MTYDKTQKILLIKEHVYIYLHVCISVGSPFIGPTVTLDINYSLNDFKAPLPAFGERQRWQEGIIMCVAERCLGEEGPGSEVAD